MLLCLSKKLPDGGESFNPVQNVEFFNNNLERLVIGQRLEDLYFNLSCPFGY